MHITTKNCSVNSPIPNVFILNKLVCSKLGINLNDMLKRQSISALLKFWWNLKKTVLSLFFHLKTSSMILQRQKICPQRTVF